MVKLLTLPSTRNLLLFQNAKPMMFALRNPTRMTRGIVAARSKEGMESNCIGKKRVVRRP